MPTEANTLALGSLAPEFSLSDVVTGQTITLASLIAADRVTSGALILFVCVHCPYVKHVERVLAHLADEFSGSIPFVAISSNDPAAHPEDAPDGMRQQALHAEWPFPYLFDETQAVARLFDAACTPEAYLVDRHRQLVYHGRIDSTRPARTAGASLQPATGDDLRAALQALVDGQPPLAAQQPSIGCSIKWK